MRGNQTWTAVRIRGRRDGEGVSAAGVAAPATLKSVDKPRRLLYTPLSLTGYTKLFNSILASTIWREDDKTRIVWITLLAMADRHGLAEGSVPGIADFARVSVDDCRKALGKLSAPDEDSRSQEHEGRRIEAVEGGWRLLNHEKYRQKLSADERREYLKLKQREYRRRGKSTGVDNVSDTDTVLTHTEAEAEAEALREDPGSLKQTEAQVLERLRKEIKTEERNRRGTRRFR